MNMKNPKVKAGIIGSGFSASFHFEAIKKTAYVETEIQGVYSKTKQHRETFARNHEITPYEHVEKLIDDCDVVHICIPPYAHEEMGILALERDTYPIIEKPLTGYFGDGSPDFHGDRFPKQTALDHALEILSSA